LQRQHVVESTELDDFAGDFQRFVRDGLGEDDEELMGVLLLSC
jgi:hypothetical protein